MKASLLMQLILLSISEWVFSQAGSLDTSFGSDGIVTILPDYGYGQDLAVQSDGKIVVGGEYSSDGFVVARFNTDGSIDNTFGVNGIAQTIVGLGFNHDEQLAIQADGKIVVGGVCSNFDGYFNGALVRFNANGTLDNTFGIGGKVIYAYNDPHQYANDMYDLAITTGQKIMTVGRTTTNLNSSAFAVARFNADGSFDNTFGSNGIVLTFIGNPFAAARTIEIQNDGKAVVGGSTYSTTAQSFAIARYNVDGSLDNSFSNDGIDTIYFYNHSLYSGGAVGRDVFIQPDGKILIVGQVGSSKDNIDYNAIARYNADGTFDNSFGAGGKELMVVPGYTENDARVVTGQSDGKIIIGGYCFEPDSPNPPPHTMLIRLLENGDFDSDFGDNGIADTLPEFDVAIMSAVMDQQQRIVGVGPSDSGLTVMRFLTGLNVGIVDIQSTVNPLFIYPNPIANSATLEYILIRDEKLSISLYALDGTLLQIFKKGEFHRKGEHHEFLQFDPLLPSGNYILSVANDIGSQNVKILLTR